MGYSVMQVSVPPASARVQESGRDDEEQEHYACDDASEGNTAESMLRGVDGIGLCTCRTRR